MRAIQINSPNQIGIAEVENKVLASGNAIIEVKSMGVCGSDVHAYAGKSPNVTYPIIIGHETAGVVCEIDENNEYGIMKGDKVVLNPYMYCGECYPCSQGRTNCCESLKCLGVQIAGSMSEFFSHPIKQLVKVPQDMDWESLAVAEPLVIALHAIHSCDLKAGEHIAIIGAGAIGMLTGMAAKAYGGIPIMIDVVDERLQMAREFGIDLTVNPMKSNAVEDINKMTKGRMAECVVEASGSTIGVRSTLDYAAATGRIALTGWPNREIELPTAVITRKELQIRGSRTGISNEFRESIDLIYSGKVEAKKIISKVTTFEELPMAINHLHEAPGEWLKIVALM
jgi:L-gulonate 5-dehydrogenase